MSNGWREAYNRLTEYVAGNPKIEIGASVVSIPEDVRPEFYRLFNALRKAFMEEKFPALLSEGQALSNSYIKVEEEVTKALGVESISTPSSLHWFLRDPVDGLVRELFDPLFDLLKGKVDIQTFEERASRNIEASFGPLYRSGYEKWVMLSLVKLLEADKAFRVSLPEFSTEEEGMMGATSTEEEVPAPQESKRLSFDHTREEQFTIPDLIAHSTKIERYVAIRTQLADALCKAKVVSEKREWYPVSSIKKEYGPVVIWPDMLVNIGDRPEDIALIADTGRISRPDMIIECMEQKDWFKKEGLEKVKLHHDILKPKLGTFVASRELVPNQAYQELMPKQVSGDAILEAVNKEPEELVLEEEPVPEEKPKKQRAGINILVVGFDQSKLVPIINKMINQEDKVQ